MNSYNTTEQIELFKELEDMNWLHQFHKPRSMMMGGSLSNEAFIDFSFQAANWVDSMVSEVKFIDGHFLECQFSSLEFKNCLFRNVQFKAINASSLLFQNCTFENCQFEFTMCLSPRQNIRFKDSFLDNAHFGNIKIEEFYPWIENSICANLVVPEGTFPKSENFIVATQIKAEAPKTIPQNPTSTPKIEPKAAHKLEKVDAPAPEANKEESPKGRFGGVEL